MKYPVLHGMQTVMINQNPMGLLYIGVLIVGVVSVPVFYEFI